MSDALETLLARLAALTSQAQRRWEAEQRAEYKAEEWEPEGLLWLTLECGYDHEWLCGWRVQEDETHEWAIRALGATPVQAVQALLKLMEEAK